MSGRRGRYPAEYRQQMVDLVRSGRSPDQLAREFEPSAQSIPNWAAQADRDEGRRGDGLTTAEREELRRLRRENRPLREGREILARQRPGSPGEQAQGVYGFTGTYQAEFRSAAMARVSGVSTSGYLRGAQARSIGQGPGERRPV